MFGIPANLQWRDIRNPWVRRPLLLLMYPFILPVMFMGGVMMGILAIMELCWMPLRENW
jgi:hypothetical protein